MKSFKTYALVILALTGCTTNGAYDEGKTWALVGGIAIGAAVAISQQGDTSDPALRCYYSIDASGSQQICR